MNNERRKLIKDEIEKEMATELSTAGLPARAAQSIDIVLKHQEMKEAEEKKRKRAEMTRGLIVAGFLFCLGLVVGAASIYAVVSL